MNHDVLMLVSDHQDVLSSVTWPFGIIWQQPWVDALANCFDLVLTIPALLMLHDCVTTNGSRSLGGQLK